MTTPVSLKNIPEDVSDKDEKKKPAAKKPLINMERFGLTNEAQWLLIVPNRYEDYKTFTSDINNLYQGTPALMRGVVTEKKMFDNTKNETTNPRSCVRILISFKNQAGQFIKCSAFGMPGFAWMGYKPGSSLVIRGVPKINDYTGRMEISSVEPVLPEKIGKLYAIYPPIRRSKGEHFENKVKEYRGLVDTAAELLTWESGWNDPRYQAIISDQTQFKDARELLQQLHWPDSLESAEMAQRAAKFLSSWSLIRKTNHRVSSIQPDPKSIINVDMDVLNDLINRVPFKLTGDQNDCIQGIAKSLKSAMPMHGLLTGDVGTGKTLTFLLPLAAAHKAGKKVMLMTPNLLLIDQVGNDLKQLFPEIEVAAITGTKSYKGDPDKAFIIGTSALIGNMKKGKLGRKPDFLVVDEQHKFSVEQRELLSDPHTNTLEATATPIPRTAALATHGAKDLFILKEVPVDKTINTVIINRGQALEARNEILSAVLQRNEQAAVIYPLVETDNAEKQLQSVKAASESWSRYVPIEKIAVLHGKLKDEEKKAILDEFRAGTKRLLLSSTVIEVGVTLPELKSLLVLSAERFGVVTLHQLRGRLARNGGHGEFMMFTDNEDEEVIDRLNLVVKNQDGFSLAEKDAEKRGFGDILGIDSDQQSGATKTVFMGVNITPNSISHAAHLFERVGSYNNTQNAVNLLNSQMKKDTQKQP